MILTLNHKIWFLILSCILLCPGFALAQSALTLSVSPTLVELGSQPDDTWRSELKVINPNNYDLTVYGSVVNFYPRGENGEGDFAPVLPSEAKGATLAEWVTLENDTVIVPAGSSADIAFVVSVPEDAEPGSHFAAILIGTQPPTFSPDAANLRTAQVVTSLFFLNVSGDIVESGSVRSFVATDSYTSVPQTDIELRFENDGNVHLRPTGDIVITNMWGKERGRIPVNYNTSFGNALPDTIRKYDFAWEGEISLSDIGRYKAEVALVFGDKAKQFATATTAFWVIPVKGLLITLGVILGVGLFIIWAVKAYIRRIFTLAGIDPVTLNRQEAAVETDIDIRAVSAPVRTGIVDFKRHIAHIHKTRDVLRELWLFGKAYRSLVVVLVGITVVVWLGAVFLDHITAEDTAYTVSVGATETAVNYNAEEVAFMRITGVSIPATYEESHYSVQLINTTTQAGSVGSLAAHLFKNEIPVTQLRVETDRAQERTIILFPAKLQSEALALSKLLGGVILSTTDTIDDVITVYVGNDMTE